MKTQNWILLSALAIGSFATALQAEQLSSASSMLENSIEKKCAENCTLSTEEQAFADQLTPSNRGIFAQQFNAAQRAQAMHFSGQVEDEGSLLTADAAVEKVTAESQAASLLQKPCESCPAK